MLKEKARESAGLTHLCLALWFEERTYATWMRVGGIQRCASERLSVVAQEEGAFEMNCSAVCFPDG